MKTLVIHPSDKSTDFLSYIYKDKDYDVIRDLRKYAYSNKTKLINKINDYDRILMMGHGSSMGLFNVYNGEFFGYAVDDNFTDVLKTKQTISIWCYSSTFYKRNNLSDNNLHTGMIISEPSEELYMLGSIVLDEDKMLDNMNIFAKSIGAHLDEQKDKMIKNILFDYNFDDAVTQFNRKNITLV